MNRIQQGVLLIILRQIILTEAARRKEFNPNTTFPLGGTGSLNYNAAYHPVAATGRNQTGVFDPANSTRYGLLTASGLSRSNTINLYRLPQYQCAWGGDIFRHNSDADICRLYY